MVFFENSNPTYKLGELAVSVQAEIIKSLKIRLYL